MLIKVIGFQLSLSTLECNLESVFSISDFGLSWQEGLLQMPFRRTLVHVIGEGFNFLWKNIQEVVII